MKERITARLLALDRRALWALLGGLLLFVALESWLLMLRAPLAEWRTLVVQRESGEAARTAGTLQADIERTKLAIIQAKQALKAAVLPRADDDMQLYLIAILDRLARQHAVSLGQVQRGALRVEQDMQVATFDGEARGSYLDLVKWLSEVETQIKPLKVTELKLSSTDEGRQVSLRAKFTAYLPISDGLGGP